MAMQRRLEFESLDKDKRFILCYQSLCFSKAELARNELRAHGDILTELEKIGVLSNPGRNESETALYKCPNGGHVVLDELRFMILKRFVEGFVPDLHRSLSREMALCFEWLEKVPETPIPDIASLSKAE